MKKVFCKTICLICGLMLIFSSSPLLHANQIIIETETGDSIISESLPFEFQLISNDEDNAYVEFIPFITENYSFYISEKGRKDSLQEISPLEYDFLIDQKYSFVYKYAIGNILYVYNGTVCAVNFDEYGIIVKTSDIVENTTYNGDITKNIRAEILTASISSTEVDIEEEPNDTWEDANSTNDNVDNYGTLDSQDDIDWWKIEFDDYGEANFWLGNIPNSCDYDMYLYHEDNLDDTFSLEQTSCLALSTNGNNAEESITYDVEPNVCYYVMIIPYSGSSYSEYLLSIENDSSAEEDEYEPNDNMNSATLLDSSDIIEATIHDQDDEDYYEIEVYYPRNVYIGLFDIPINCDFDLILCDSSGNEIESSMQIANTAEEIDVTIENPGSYYIYVQPYDNCYSGKNYTLEVEVQVPELNLSHYYDQGYEVRFSNAYTNIGNHHSCIRDILEELFHIDISRNRSDYTSYADDCKIEQDGSVTSSNLANQCSHTEEHTDRGNLVTEFIEDESEGTTTDSNILWTGHIMDGNATSASYTARNVVVMTPATYENENTETEINVEIRFDLLHEVSHQIGAGDHYCDLEQGRTVCDNVQCYACVLHLENEPDCIMSNRENIENSDIDDLYCSDCIELIEAHLSNHH